MKWVRIPEGTRRWHAVYVETLGLYWLYCARTIKPLAAIDPMAEPPAQCRCCESRVRNPFLVPEPLRRMKP